MDPMSVVAFLKKFRNICVRIDIHEGLVTLFVSYFMKKPAPLSMKIRLPPSKIRANGLHDERLSTNFEVVSNFLSSYVIDDILA